MKVLLYFQDPETIKTSGIGRAMKHQMIALKTAGVDFTIDPTDDFDLVHINTLMNESERLLKKCNKKGIPVIVHGHSTYEDFRNSFRLWKVAALWFNRQITYMYKHAGMIITPTPYSKKLIEGYKLGPKVIAISNGIEVVDYQHDEKKIDDFKKFFNIENGQKVVIGIGYPFQRKGILDFFEVARKFPDVKFIWFGHLQKMLTQVKILRGIKHRPDNVIMPGYIDNSIIKGAMQYASCLFFPSYEETEGIVVLEALASHCLVLVRRIGVYDGWLKENENCLMASSNEEFAEKLNYLFDHDCHKLVDSGYELAEKRNLAIVGEQLKAAYEQFYKEFSSKKR
ncbi:MAG TPA: glycosyltransferase family 4 protein [Bacilli bacterium]|nr:glycosyltransferase family 4 protein [Bacilli bacterium]HPS18871.1 glycosyltransferase family 4 protein [Bacilli bacterium]